MSYCTQCGHKLSFFEHTINGMCSGCAARVAEQKRTEEFHALIEPYTHEQLPTINIKDSLLQQEEVAYYAAPCVLKEAKRASLGYYSVSQGISIPVPGFKIGGYPIRYSPHISRGLVVKHEELCETSRGLLIATNHRLFLDAVPGKKPLSLSLSKIVNFHVYENGLEVWSEDKEHPLFFALEAPASEIYGLCLTHKTRD